MEHTLHAHIHPETNRGRAQRKSVLRVFLLACVVCCVSAPSNAQTAPAATSGEQAAAPVSPTTSQPTDAPDKTEARQLSKTLFWSFIIFLVVIFAAVIIVMFSRRFKAYINPKTHSHAPTQTYDVWAMHKLPDGAIDELDDDPDDPV